MNSFISNSKFKLLLEIFTGLFFSFVFIYAFSILLDYLVRNSNDSQLGKINLIFSNEINEDVLCFGSSVSEVGLNSKIVSEKTGLTVYNLSIDGTRIRQVIPLIEKVSTSSNKPKIILFGLSFFELSVAEEMSATDRYYAHYREHKVVEMFKDMQPDLARRLSYVPFFKLSQCSHTYYKNAAIGFRNILRNSTTLKTKQLGHSPNNVDFNQDSRNKIKYSKTEIEISMEEYNRFERLIKYVKSQNIQPVLIMFPLYQTGHKHFKNYADYLHKINQLAQKNDVKILNYSQNNICNNSRYFYNMGHLNNIGSDTLSGIIGGDLKELLVSVR